MPQDLSHDSYTGMFVYSNPTKIYWVTERHSDYILQNTK